MNSEVIFAILTINLKIHMIIECHSQHIRRALFVASTPLSLTVVESIVKKNKPEIIRIKMIF